MMFFSLWGIRSFGVFGLVFHSLDLCFFSPERSGMRLFWKILKRASEHKSKSPIFDPWVCHIQSLTIFHNIKTGWFRMDFKFWPFEPYLGKWSKCAQHMFQTGASTTRWFYVVPDVEELVILRWGITCPLIPGMLRGVYKLLKDQRIQRSFQSLVYFAPSGKFTSGFL